MRRVRSHLTYANVMATLAIFVALGGTALASVIISSNSQVGRGTISGHRPPSGKHPNIIGGSISGEDIADRSGVDTCQRPLTKKLGALCVGSDGVTRSWDYALAYCAGYGLRLPTLSEAVTLASNYDVPGVTAHQLFWTDAYYVDSGDPGALIVLEGGVFIGSATSASNGTVCVTEPSA